jgi:hypothetical protein
VSEPVTVNVVRELPVSPLSYPVLETEQQHDLAALG